MRKLVVISIFVTCSLILGGCYDPIDLAKDVAYSDVDEMAKEYGVPNPLDSQQENNEITGQVVADDNTTEIASGETAESDWPIYENYILLFLFRYPPEGMLSSVNEISSRIDLPREVDTNLKEKYLTVDLYYIDSNENALQDCLRDSARTDKRMIGENEFYILDESEGAAGTFYSWMRYSTANEKNCVSITYFTVSVNPDNYMPPLTAFDQQVEFEDFKRIISTFEWTIE